MAVRQSEIADFGFGFLVEQNIGDDEIAVANPVLMGMGKAVQPIFEAMGFRVLRAEHADEVVPTADAALTMAYKGGEAVAVLLTQKLIGAKVFA